MSRLRIAFIAIGTALLCFGLLSYEYWGPHFTYAIEARLEIAAGLGLIVAGCLYRGAR